MYEPMPIPPALPENEQPRVRYYHVSLTEWTREGDAVGRVIAELPGDTAYPINLPLPVTVPFVTARPEESADSAGRDVPGEASASPVPLELRVPAGIPGEQVIVSVEEPPQRPHRRKRHRRRLPPRISIVQVLEA